MPELRQTNIKLAASGVSGLSWPVYAMIISDYNGANKDFLCAGHTIARNYYPLLTALGDGTYSGVDFYLF